MPTLAEYITATTDILHDAGFQFYSEALVTRNVNKARRQVAMVGKCVRVIPTPGTGVGEMATVLGQEAYPFSDFNALVALEPGVLQIQSVAQVCVSWGGIIPSLKNYTWNVFNAWFRAINVTGIQGFPACWAQHGEGASGSIYLYPIPTQAMAMLWDCVCLPVDLENDATVDAIPVPFDDAVSHYAAYLCLLNAQRRRDAQDSYKQYVMNMRDAAAATMPWMVPDYYSIRFR